MLLLIEESDMPMCSWEEEVYFVFSSHTEETNVKGIVLSDVTAANACLLIGGFLIFGGLLCIFLMYCARAKENHYEVSMRLQTPFLHRIYCIVVDIFP